MHDEPAAPAGATTIVDPPKPAIQVISKMDRSGPIQVISMKTPGAAVQPAAPAPTPVIPRPKLRAVSEITPANQQNLGHVAPPYDPEAARARKLREYEADWNLARQDAVDLYHRLASGSLKYEDPEALNKSSLIINRASPEVLTVVEFHARKAKAEGRKVLAVYFDNLGNMVRQNIGKSPVYLDRHPHLMPSLSIRPDGELDYREVPRPGTEVQVKIRSRFAAQRAWVLEADDRSFRVVGDASLRAVTPGQAAVLYDGARVIGGGWIRRGLRRESFSDQAADRASR